MDSFACRIHKEPGWGTGIKACAYLLGPIGPTEATESHLSAGQQRPAGASPSFYSGARMGDSEAMSSQLFLSHGMP